MAMGRRREVPRLEMMEWCDSDTKGTLAGSQVGDLHAPPESQGRGNRERSLTEFAGSASLSLCKISTLHPGRPMRLLLLQNKEESGGRREAGGE